MPTVSGGRVTEKGIVSPGTRERILSVEGVPTDALIGQAFVLGMIAQNVLTGNIYERQAGAWVRIDTL
jgi:hypothetical protein